MFENRVDADGSGDATKRKNEFNDMVEKKIDNKIDYYGKKQKAQNIKNKPGALSQLSIQLLGSNKSLQVN